MVRSGRLRILLGALILLAVAAVGRAAQNGNGGLQPIPESELGGAGALGGELGGGVGAISDGNNSLGLSAAPNAKTINNSEAVFGGSTFCSAPSRFWFRTDYLYWWTKGAYTPALVTQGIATQGLTDQNDPAGSLGYAGTTVVAGQSQFNSLGKSGVRLAGGMWLDACENWGIEGDYLNVGGNGEDLFFNSDNTGNPVLARPYYDVQNAREWRQLVSYPNTLAGSVGVQSSDYFNSAGVMIKRNLIRSGCCPTDSCGSSDSCSSSENCGSTDRCGYNSGDSGRVDLLAGYRYYGLSDKLVIHENLNGLGALAGTNIQVTDSFRTQNDFHGVDLGFDAIAYRGRWSFDLMMKAALGSAHQTTVIGGKTVRSNSSGTITDFAGVYAVGTNSGTYTQNEFTVIPQIGLQAGYQLTPRMRVYAGYNLIYWAAVQRASDAFDSNIDPRNIPPVQAGGTHFPEFTPNGSSFWAQGGNVGFDIRF